MSNKDDWTKYETYCLSVQKVKEKIDFCNKISIEINVHEVEVKKKKKVESLQASYRTENYRAKFTFLS